MTPLGRRIVHLASGREWRGGQNQVLLLARELSATGVDQVVVTGKDSLLATRLQAAGVPVRQTGWRIGLSPGALAGALAEVRRGASLLHAHDAHSLTLAGVVATVTGTPFVVTRRVDFHLRRPGFWRRADRVIAISQAVKQILIADGIPSTRIATVHSGIDIDAVRRAEAGNIRTELGLPAQSPLAVTVGALVGHKDHATLVSAAAVVAAGRPDLRWAIAGEGPLRPDLTAQIERLGLGDRVHLLGMVTGVHRLIAAADVFVMSSKEEGLGTTVLDAMAIGIPVASTSGGGLAELLDGGAGILSPVGDPAALAASVERLLQDRRLRETTVAVARQRVARFSAREMADGVLSVYRSVIGER